MMTVRTRTPFRGTGTGPGSGPGTRAVFEAAASESPRPPTAYTRAVALGIVPFLVVASVMLYLLPTRTEQLFAWTIAPPISAMFLGSAYVGGLVFFLHVVRAARWEQVKYGFPAVLLFSILLAIATVLHWDRFHFGHVSFIVWATLYFLTPVLVAAVLAVQHTRTRRRPRATPEAGEQSSAPSIAHSGGQPDIPADHRPVEPAAGQANIGTDSGTANMTADTNTNTGVGNFDDIGIDPAHNRNRGTVELSNPAAGLVPSGARIAFAALGLAALVVGLVMFVAPTLFLESWAWPLTPLTARVTGAVLTLPGMVNVWMLRDGRWSAFCRIFDAEILSLVFLAGALVLARGDVSWSRPVAAVVAVGLAASLAGYVAFWLYCRRFLRPR